MRCLSEKFLQGFHLEDDVPRGAIWEVLLSFSTSFQHIQPMPQWTSAEAQIILYPAPALSKFRSHGSLSCNRAEKGRQKSQRFLFSCICRSAANILVLWAGAGFFVTCVTEWYLTSQVVSLVERWICVSLACVDEPVHLNPDPLFLKSFTEDVRIRSNKCLVCNYKRRSLWFLVCLVWLWGVVNLYWILLAFLNDLPLKANLYMWVAILNVCYILNTTFQ